MRRIYLDLDGVLADFYGHARAILGAEYPTDDTAAAWRRLSAVPHLYRSLPPLQGAVALYRALAASGRRLAVLTALPHPTGHLMTAPRDKRAWVARHLSATLQVITVSHGEEKAVFAAPEALLIDDSARNLSAWEAAGGMGFLHRSCSETSSALAQLLFRSQVETSLPADSRP